MDHERVSAHAFGLEQTAQLLCRTVIAHAAHDEAVWSEGSEVARHIRRTAREQVLAHDFDHRHGCFWRNTPDIAPHEVVEHHVANDEDAGAGKALELDRRHLRKGRIKTANRSSSNLVQP